MEGVSPGFVDRDIRLQFTRYPRHVMRAYWLVFPEVHSVTADVLAGGGHYPFTADYAAPSSRCVATQPGIAVGWRVVWADA